MMRNRTKQNEKPNPIIVELSNKRKQMTLLWSMLFVTLTIVILLCWNYPNISHLIEIDFIALGSFNEINNKYITNNTFQFNDQIGLVITSCARWNKLEIALRSFEKYNTYSHIVKKYVIDDCNDDIGFNLTASKFPDYIFVHTSTPRTNEYSSSEYRMILATKESHDFFANDTEIKYIFYTEDDWRFYKYGFIEDSLSILKSKNKHKTLSFVNLRNVQYYKPFLIIHQFCGGWNKYRLDTHNVFISQYNGFLNKKVEYFLHRDNQPSFSHCWGHWSANPGLKIKSVFLDIWEQNNCKTEKCIACAFKKANYSIANTISNGYVGHMGYKSHVRQRFDVNMYNENKSKHITEHDHVVASVNHTELRRINDKWFINETNCKYSRQINEHLFVEREILLMLNDSLIIQ
eukprot:510634_1